MKLFRSRAGPQSSRRAREHFHLFDRKTFANYDSLGKWSLAEAENSEEGAARAILGLLREKPRLRRRFPRAISAGWSGEFGEWLRAESARLGLAEPALRNIESVFRESPGQKVRELFLHSPELRARFPLGLLPVGQGKFVRWLLRERREKHGLREGEILWFLHETAETVPQMIQLSWLINPGWQEAHPFGLTNAGEADFRRWLRLEFDLRLAKTDTLPLLPEKTQSLLRSNERNGGINLLSHFCYPSGIQQAAANIQGALEAVGWQVSARDVPTSPRTDIEEREQFLGLEIFPVTITNVAPAPHFRDAYERSGLTRRPGLHRIAYWAWELDQIPAEWVELAPLLDEIWAPTAFVADAFRKRMPLPVHEILPGLELGEITPVTRSSLGIPEKNYVFLFMFDMSSQMERKNPLAVIRAFAAAFPKQHDVNLVIKVTRGATKPAAFALLQTEAQAAGVILIDGVLPHAQAYGILQMCDCFVSLHRSEGFGLCLAEAMLLGKPVIATKYSGNLAFMHSGNSLLVDYVLKEIFEDMPTYKRGNHWAEPSLENAVAQLRYCYHNRVAAAALGAIAETEIREKFSLRAAGERMIARLQAISA
ncbi:MAG: glycosyltransferase [Chthoniobacterales bacterium]